MGGIWEVGVLTDDLDFKMSDDQMNRSYQIAREVRGQVSQSTASTHTHFAQTYLPGHHLRQASKKRKHGLGKYLQNL